MFLRQVLKWMKQLGLNQSALAKRMNVSRPYISKVLRSDVNISFGTAAKLAKALEMVLSGRCLQSAGRVS